MRGASPSRSPAEGSAEQRSRGAKRPRIITLICGTGHYLYRSKEKVEAGRFGDDDFSAAAVETPIGMLRNGHHRL